MMKQLITGLATGCLLTLSAHAADKVALDGAEVGKWTMDFDAAAKLAAEKKLPMMLNFTGSDWCGWCKLMDGSVFAKEDWQKFAADNVVLVTLDFPQDKTIVPEKYVARNKAMQKKFEVGGYPTYVILDSDGTTQLGKLSAGQGKTPASFIAEFKGVIQMSPKGIEAYVKANPEKAEAFKKAIQNVKDSEKALTDWIATKPEQNEENNTKFKAFQKEIKDAKDALEKF